MTVSPYCRAVSVNGQTYADPSEDLLYELMYDFELPHNGYLIVEGSGDDGWYVVAALLEDGTYEVRFRDPMRRVYRVQAGARLPEIVNDMIVWITDTARFHTARAAQAQHIWLD
ncbi:hypothetical protein [Streptomyces sp. NPDC050534]|uniref:hypothetical protein n=1 Tax=Streptomyces sp. NPDC050534 TaxID=3365625 RepID=UPI0037934AF8